ncbi:unnamed protein product [Vitrella brassicaformis CCMP3155]|uniref:Uncharacterized protein n=1 Tax=Vitrella brassicaformis (strain CCMP3155) TaxID=1169540 RepID=A0A0G4G6J5_VITBC|nr:unnamed protein product [Vitrella brassicaformis CCMP3155]|eukprot:CEM23971.1 unnamed protein product [Vitrella brassicaformis CCMP3155]
MTRDKAFSHCLSFTFWTLTYGNMALPGSSPSPPPVYLREAASPGEVPDAIKGFHLCATDVAIPSTSNLEDGPVVRLRGERVPVGAWRLSVLPCGVQRGIWTKHDHVTPKMKDSGAGHTSPETDPPCEPAVDIMYKGTTYVLCRGLARTALFDPSTSSWLQKSMRPPSPVPEPPYIASLFDGEIYLFSGRTSDATSGNDPADVTIYEVDNNRWRSGPAAKLVRAPHVAAAIDDYLILVGSTYEGGLPTTVVVELLPSRFLCERRKTKAERMLQELRGLPWIAVDGDKEHFSYFLNQVAERPCAAAASDDGPSGNGANDTREWSKGPLPPAEISLTDVPPGTYFTGTDGSLRVYRPNLSTRISDVSKGSRRQYKPEWPSIALSISSASAPLHATEPYPTFYLSPHLSEVTFLLTNENADRPSGRLYPILEGDASAFAVTLPNKERHLIEGIQPKENVTVTVKWRGDQSIDDLPHVGFLRIRRDVWVLFVADSRTPSHQQSAPADENAIDRIVAVGSRSGAIELSGRNLSAALSRGTSYGDTSTSMDFSFILDEAGPFRGTTVAAIVGREFPPLFVATKRGAFLHAELKSDVLAVDYDGDGHESIFFDASASHTHEWGQSLVSYSFQLNGQTIKESTCEEHESNCERTARPRIPIGTHNFEVTVGDRNGQTASLEKEVLVASVDEVPGCALAIYNLSFPQARKSWLEWTANSETLSGAFSLTDGGETLVPSWVTSSAVALAESGSIKQGQSPFEVCGVAPDTQYESFMDWTLKENLLIRALAIFELDDNDGPPPSIRVKGGEKAAVWVDGTRYMFFDADNDRKFITIPMSKNSRPNVEVRWLIEEATTFPLKVDVRTKGRRWQWKHSQRSWLPFINKIDPDRVHPDGGTISLDGVGFLAPQGRSQKEAV